MMRIPLDYRETQWWRGLVGQIGVGPASVVVLTLWRELGYQARQGNLPGRVTPQDADMFLRELDRDGVPTEALLENLERCGALVKRDEGGWLCRPFMQASGQLTANALGVRGGEGRAFRYRVQAAQASGGQMALMIEPKVLVDEQGQALTADWVERVRSVIALSDSSLAARPRQPAEYTEGLVQSALAVARKYTDGQIRGICRQLYFQRHHPTLHGMVAEKLLARFEELAVACGAMEGVGTGSERKA